MNYNYTYASAALSGQPSAFSYTHNGNNELLSYDNVSYDYDDDGNMVRKTVGAVVTNFIYDIHERMGSKLQYSLLIEEN